MKQDAVTYFEHYARTNDLSPAGRRKQWPYFRHNYAPLLPSDRNARILDFGCGAGKLLEWLASEGYTSAQGIDTDPGQITFCRSIGVNAKLANDPGMWLRGERPFNVIVLTEVLEHIPRHEDIDLLRSLREALTEDGMLIITVPNASASFGGRIRYIDSTHHRSYTEMSLHHDLEMAGFSSVNIRPDDTPPENLKDALTQVVRSFFRGFRRLEAISTWGMGAAKIPLSLLLVAEARK